MIRKKLLVVRGGSLQVSPHVLALVNALARSVFDVTLAVYGTSVRPVDLDPKINLFLVDGSSGHYGVWSKLRIISNLRRLLTSEAPEIVYVIDSWTIPYVWAALASSPFSHSRSRLLYHTFEWLDPAVHGLFSIAFERRFSRRADLVISVERTRARLLRSLYHLKRTPLWVRNGLLSRPMVAPDQELRASLVGDDAPRDAVLMVYPSFASPERLTLELIKAFVMLPDRYRLITFASNDEYGKECIEQIAAQCLTRRVRILPRVIHSDMMRYLSCADIGAILHDDETSSGNLMCSPQRLAEYTASGIPFVASDYPPMEAVVYKFGLGQCCNPHDVTALARAIQDIGDNGDLHRKKLHVREVFERELAFEHEVPKLVAALNLLTTEQSGR